MMISKYENLMDEFRLLSKIQKRDKLIKIFWELADIWDNYRDILNKLENTPNISDDSAVYIYDLFLDIMEDTNTYIQNKKRSKFNLIQERLLDIKKREEAFITQETEECDIIIQKILQEE